MNRSLTEQKVLKKLGIEDFRHLTKDKAIMMVSMLDRMEPEVAKKAIEQFPHFSDTMKELLLDYKQTLDKALDENAESVNSFYESCNATIMSLQKLLEKDNLEFEERKYIIDKMMEINKMKGAKDTENKKFITSMALIGAVTIGTIASILSSTLGGNTKIESHVYSLIARRKSGLFL